MSDFISKIGHLDPRFYSVIYCAIPGVQMSGVQMSGVQMSGVQMSGVQMYPTHCNRYMMYIIPVGTFFVENFKKISSIDHSSNSEVEFCIVLM